jgi:AcrR family transcriptional regulator
MRLHARTSPDAPDATPAPTASAATLTASALPVTPAPEAPEAIPPAVERGLRADATRNRLAVVRAAREVFAEQGLEAPLEEIARRADVGIATLYRRFPSRESLIAAALLEKIREYAAAARRALAASDPWDGFACLVRAICELQARDRGLGELLSMTLPASDEVERLRAEAQVDVAELVSRAQAAGRLRPDFVAEDLLLMLVANAAVARITRSDAPDAWQRFVGLILDAFQYTGGDSLPTAPSAAQMTRVRARLAADRGCGAVPLTGNASGYVETDLRIGSPG